MKIHTQSQIAKILNRYNADHDTGPEAPVTWREERLAQAVMELQDELAELQMKVSRIVDAIPGMRGYEV